MCVTRVDVFLDCMSHLGGRTLAFEDGLWCVKGSLESEDQHCGIVIGNFGDLGALSSCPHPNCLDLKAQPIKAVYRLPGQGPQRLGECQPWTIEGERKLTS